MLRSLLGRLGCSPAEGMALALLVAGAIAGLGLLWVLARPDTPEAPALDGALPLPFPDGQTTAGRSGDDGSVTRGEGVAGSENEPGGSGHEAEAASAVLVHVAGQVASPGLYRLPPGSRVGDALERAGGPLPEARLDLVNLAQPLVDGEQVLVPGPDDPAPHPGVGASGVPPRGATGSGGNLDLNRASAAELQELPGVGPVLAERILAHREAIGGFRTVDELRDVKGIGEKTFAELEPLVTLG